MNQLTALAALHAEIDVVFERQRLVAGDVDGVERIEAKQRLNDQAYFVLCWGQFESIVDDRCRDVIRAGRAQPNWTRQRVWQLFNPEDKRLSGLSFHDRLALLLDRGAGSGSPYARAIGFYDLRNEIAHGRFRPDRIDVQAVVQDLFQLRSVLA